ncbi:MULTISPECIES: LexA family protein [Acinetobacter calcoaceticus/baumannii complex]|uniref:LexA family protein n=1 Tax=Acinetobacter calcoaceticus/baumannii complex TaxID=909768 RepID=UPI001057631D|nr:S24 family peptidase [Acinetobacter baumannii]EKX9915339.1 helix-turn-helix domain-containing protein [Acinetobacter baumannii]MBJ9493407.1 helix-turn-helix domain-containing protein [Acinetobacter baumannii]MDC4595722.1 helix-turn-helix domain-containing protein [Acinetobacter baumannii]MDC5216086.1 helix-turn-helix domain-containing protein [Acinetobacter baumannii]MDC5382154.1 helix-turn-helix domain-containing protein [Acinetobacter baumannii]
MAQSVSDRIQIRMKDLGLSQADIMRATKAARGTVSGWVNGSNSPSAKHIESLAECLKTSSTWLLTGKETTNSTNKTANDASNVTKVDKELRSIPVFDYVQAGLFHDVGYDGINPIGSTWTTYENYKPECIFALKVEGLSMAPDFMPGDEIVVDACLEAKPGSFVIAQEVQHGIARTTFKKYRVIGVNEFGVDIIELVPLNPDFPTYNSTQIEISIIGVVVRHNREFKY